MVAQIRYELQVDLGQRSYPIRIGSGLLGDAEQIIPYLSGKQALVVTNECVAPLYLDSLCAALSAVQVDTLVLPDGESQKQMATLSDIFDVLVTRQHHRSTTVLALGGGVIGDLAGFAAACYQRGVGFIQLPTTLLAQVDSSVGGKTAVNHEAGKNLIGAFYQPQLVLADMDVLATLPNEEYRSGLAELVKHAIILDAEFFTWLEAKADALVARNTEVLSEALYRSVCIKAAIVAEDEREAGKRALLNFGHTFAHALEVVSGYGQWLHGEAVALGMLMALHLSLQTHNLDAKSAVRIRSLLAVLGLPIQLQPGSVSVVALRAAMAMDKKTLDSTLQLILLKDLGNACKTDAFEEQQLKRTLEAAVQGQLLF